MEKVQRLSGGGWFLLEPLKIESGPAEMQTVEERPSRPRATVVWYITLYQMGVTELREKDWL